VLVAADGALALFPFATLPGSKSGSYLIEERALAHVPSGQHLLTLGRPAKSAPNRLLVLGGLDFGTGGRWPDLPGSRAEARQVRDAFVAFGAGTARLLEGSAGDRAGLLAALSVEQRWRYLHLATHAYYDAPTETATVEANRGGPAQPEQQFLFLQNPLLLSGVVLAGANRDAAAGTLTAEEVCALDLRGCEMVVLSACQTALGEVKAGEGVLGLQRAFHLAGARAVISSLWSVHDEATQRLMQRFYLHLWGKEKMTKLQALRQAQLDMLRVGLRDPLLVRGLVNPKTGTGKRLSASVKDRSGRLPPAFWAAFVLSGDWR
jgi:CHAT domain-containing protein